MTWSQLWDTMNWSQLGDGVQHIWRADKIAIVVTLALMLVQAAVLLLVLGRTWLPLRRARRSVRAVTLALSNGDRAEAAKAATGSYSRLARAWNAALGRQATSSPDFDSLEPDEAFEAGRLLPPDYNPRIDAASPGLFTALGIVGTFFGLILGFLRVDPAEASGSVGPLLGGMVVAFLNSLLGVLLSVLWTYSSRSWRHSFDMVCDELVAAAESTFKRFGIGHHIVVGLQMVADGQKSLGKQLAEIDYGIALLRESTNDASQQLLNNLSATVGKSFESIVSMPFDRLNESVLQFDQIVQLTSERQEEIKTRLDLAAEKLAHAEQSLTATLSLAKECVEEFSLSTMQLREGTTAAEVVVEKTQAAAANVGRAAVEVQQAASRYEDLSSGLSSAIAAMQETSAALGSTSDRFEQSTAQLQQAVSTIEGATEVTVEQSVAAIRRELENAVQILVEGIRSSGEQTVSAYEQSSERVAAAVDARMSDLTDRLSAELNTLASRLPSEVESLNMAMNQIRQQIQRATRSMDDAVNQLAHRTPEALAAQLDAYDKALARATDHFAGTLEQWDAKVESIQALSGELRHFVKIVGNGQLGDGLVLHTLQPLPR